MEAPAILQLPPSSGLRPAVVLPAGPLSPGKRIFVHYFGEEGDVWHEWALLSCSAWNRWAVCTPADGVCVEDLSDFDVVPLEANALPPGLRGAVVYRLTGSDQDAQDLPEWRAIFYEGIAAAQMDRTVRGYEAGVEYDLHAQWACQLLMEGGWAAFDEPDRADAVPVVASRDRGRGRGRWKRRAIQPAVAPMAVRPVVAPAVAAGPPIPARVGAAPGLGQLMPRGDQAGPAPVAAAMTQYVAQLMPSDAMIQKERRQAHEEAARAAKSGK
jgi:hypothetical protein